MPFVCGYISPGAYNIAKVISLPHDFVKGVTSNLLLTNHKPDHTKPLR